MYLSLNPKKNMVYGPYAGVDYNFTLRRPQRIYHGATLCQSRPQPYVYQRGLIPQLENLDFASDVHSVKWSLIYIHLASFPLKSASSSLNFTQNFPTRALPTFAM
jgi:hypothetical protein